ncbi:MAG: DNA-formamidopyrimidine glycosylase family protein [Vicingaceae bacterium]
MPELPEVEAYRLYVEEALFESPIQKVELLREKVMKSDWKNFQTATQGQGFISTKRIGKYLFMELDSHQWVLFHFGMTGKPEFYQNEEVKPKHSRLIIHFESGLKLAFVCMRLFGRVELVESIEQYQTDHQLGVDALEVSEADFIDYVSASKAAVKTVLLHQKAFAGVGNWIADEVLFQAGIHPEEKAYQLSKKQLQSIFKELQEVLRIAVEKQADYHAFPDHFMVKERWGDGNCPICGEELQRIVVGGRGTYLCEQEQSK